MLCVFRDCIEPSAAACRRIWREPRNEEIALQFLNAPLQGAKDSGAVLTNANAFVIMPDTATSS